MENPEKIEDIGLYTMLCQSALPQKLILDIDDGMAFITPSEVAFVEKEQQRCIFVTSGGKRYPVKRSMGELEKSLSEYGLFRCHRSFIVNISNVRELKALQYGRGYSLIMNGGEVIPVSRSKFGALKEILMSLGKVI